MKKLDWTKKLKELSKRNEEFVRDQFRQIIGSAPDNRAVEQATREIERRSSPCSPNSFKRETYRFIGGLIGLDLRAPLGPGMGKLAIGLDEGGGSGPGFVAEHLGFNEALTDSEDTIEKYIAPLG